MSCCTTQNSGKQEFSITQGATFDLLIRYTEGQDSANPGAPIDLNGYTIKGQLREGPGEDLIADFIITATGSQLSDGEFNATLSDAVTSTLECMEYCFDIFAKSPAGDTVVLLTGQLSVSSAITEVPV